jgi:hypothetical protein
MYEFCHHCGKTIGGQDQVIGKMLTCKFCGKDIGIPQAAPQKVIVNQADQLVQQQKAAVCPLCQQLVELKPSGAKRAIVPHFGKSQPRKMCPNSGKPASA